MADNSQCITPLDKGSINWTTGTITVTGFASPESNIHSPGDTVPGSARADANRRLLDIMKGIRISNTLSVGEYASRNDIILAGIEARARDAVTVQQYYTSALDVELTIETQIFGGLLQLILPEDIRQIPKINPETITQADPTNKPYTGLILDLRGLNFEPVLYPTIISEQGREIYSALFISREFAVQYGVARYTCSMEMAREWERIGKNPLIFKGLRKSGKDHSAVVINSADTKKIEKATERHEFLRECRVVLILGDPPAQTSKE